LYYTEQALSRSKIHPNITLLKLLEERVRDRLNARVAPILSKKKKKIAAVNLARSLLTLFGSQWLQKPWNSQEIFFMHDQNTNEIVDLQMPYILSTLTQNNWIESGPESLEYCFLFVFAFGILLLELELDQSIPMIDEDEEEADEDFPAIYMSLLRTFLGRKEDLDDPYLEDVIESCLDIRNKVESIKHPSLSNDLKLRAAFLKYVVQPLTQRLQAVHPEISLDALAVPQQNVGAKLSHTFTNDGQRSPGVPLLKSSTNIPLDQSFSSHQSASTKNPKAPTDWRVPPIRTQTWNPLQPRHRRDFEIAIICALPIEAEMVRAIFDEHWDSNGEIYGKAQGDRNAYSTGRIGRHNIVLAYMPGMGNNSAAIVANNCRFSFEGIKLALVVGICGGVPFRKNGEEIVLGDVVISDGIVPFDFGRQFPNQFIRKNTLLDSPGRPNIEIRSILAMLRVPSHRKTLQDKTSQYLSDINRGLDEEVVYPGVDEDKLYEPNYHHKHQTPSNCEICSISNHEGDQVCESALISSCEQLSCNEMRLVPRSRLSNIRARTGNTKDTGPHQPTINFGLVASGNVVMKSGRDRDNIASQEDVIAFEMEGAGVWDNFPCLIIKGVCDYADSHKNKTWQNYAAATAAACVKAFLESWAVGGSRLPNH
jgi:nucleoside phosphorylase